MEQLKTEDAATEEPGPTEAKAVPGGPVQIMRPVQHVSGLAKAVAVVRAVLPLAQKVLPLIDGQIGTVVSNLIGAQAPGRQVAQTLLPLQEGLAQLEKQHIELRAQLAGQSATLKKIDEQIETVKKLALETADNQRDLADGLERVRRRVNVAGIVGLVLLATVVALNVVVFVRIQPLLR